VQSVISVEKQLLNNTATPPPSSSSSSSSSLLKAADKLMTFCGWQMLVAYTVSTRQAMRWICAANYWLHRCKTNGRNMQWARLNKPQPSLCHFSFLTCPKYGVVPRCTWANHQHDLGLTPRVRRSSPYIIVNGVCAV